jgi:hypothetical protein
VTIGGGRPGSSGFRAVEEEDRPVRTATLSGRLALGLALAAGLVPALAGAGEAPAGGAAGGKAALEQAARMVEAARAQYLTEAHCPFSPAGAVMRVGSDPEKLAAFVREKIGYEPCAGSVRGAQGTLAAGAGGDWDRALLLRALLAEAGFGCELAVLQRKDAERLAVVDAFLASSGRERTLGAGRRPELDRLPPVSPLLEQYGIRLNNRALRLSGAVIRWQGLLDEAYDCGWTQSEQLKAVLGKAARPRSFAAWREALAAGAAERVLLHLPREKKYLDVSPEALAGGEAAGKLARRLAEVPADRVARVDLRVVLRVAEAGKKTKPTVLVEHGAPLAALLGSNLRVQVVPESSKAPTKPMTDWTGADCYDFLTGCERFQAVIESGELWKASLAFDRQGNLFAVSPDGRIEAAKALGGSVGKTFGGLGGFGGGGEEEPAKPKTSLESLDLEIDLKLPGAEPVAIRRLLCGRLRPGVSPVVHTDIACFPGPTGAGTAQWLALDAAVRNFGVIADALSGKDLDAHMRSANVRVVQRMLHEWQLARLGLADRVLSSREDLAYAGGPAIVMKTATLLPVAEPRSVARRTVVDVAFDGTRLVPRNEAAARAAFDANLLLGAAATAVEAARVREKQPGADLRGACAEFQQAAVLGDQPAVASAGSLAGVRPTELAAWGIAANQKGELLVFPGKDAPRSWWSVDPATGAALGRGDSGEGMSATEYLQIIKMNLSNLKCMIQIMGAAIRGADKNKAAREWLMCITGTDNPGNYVGAYGGVTGLSMEGGSGFSMAGDILGGAWDVAGMAGSSD